jgi:hypothetical protein
MLKIEYEKCKGPILSEYVGWKYLLVLDVANDILHSRDCKETITGLYPVIIMLNQQEQVMSIEIDTTASSWFVKPDLQVPYAEYYSVLFVEDEIPDQPASLWVNTDYSVLFIKTNSCSEKVTKSIKITDKVILEFCEEGIVSGMWLLDLPEPIRQKKPSKGIYVFETPTSTIKTLLQKEERYKGLEDTYRFFINYYPLRDWEHKKKKNKEEYLAKLYQRGFKELVIPTLTYYSEASLQALNYLTSFLTSEKVLNEQYFSPLHKRYLEAKGRRHAIKFALDSQGGLYKLELEIERIWEEYPVLKEDELGEPLTSYVRELHSAIEVISQNKVKYIYK